MEAATRILIAGAAISVALGALCAISDYAGSARHEQKIASLENTIASLRTQCAAQSQETAKVGSSWGHDQLVCDPAILSSVSGSLVGIQKKISEAQVQIDLERQYHPMELPYFISIGILLASAVPWAWYFLLRRIRELSDAVRGR
jgi:hypothetical protein